MFPPLPSLRPPPLPPPRPCSALHEAPLHQQLSAAGAQEADDTRKNYPTQSDQKVTTQAESDKKFT